VRGERGVPVSRAGAASRGGTRRRRRPGDRRAGRGREREYAPARQTTYLGTASHRVFAFVFFLCVHASPCLVTAAVVRAVISWCQRNAFFHLDIRPHVCCPSLYPHTALKSVGHLKAVCLLRPTADNVALLIKQLKEPRFASYHLCAFVFWRGSAANAMPCHACQIVDVFCSNHVSVFCLCVKSRAITLFGCAGKLTLRHSSPSNL
jgi:hypothetical protein